MHKDCLEQSMSRQLNVPPSYLPPHAGEGDTGIRQNDGLNLICKFLLITCSDNHCQIESWSIQFILSVSFQLMKVQTRDVHFK